MNANSAAANTVDTSGDDGERSGPFGVRLGDVRLVLPRMPAAAIDIIPIRDWADAFSKEVAPTRRGRVVDRAAVGRSRSAPVRRVIAALDGGDRPGRQFSIDEGPLMEPHQVLSYWPRHRLSARQSLSVRIRARPQEKAATGLGAEAGGADRGGSGCSSR